MSHPLDSLPDHQTALFHAAQAVQAARETRACHKKSSVNALGNVSISLLPAPTMNVWLF